MKVNTALNLGNINNAQVLITSAHITTNMTGNPLFSAADIVAQVTSTVTATTNLRNAMNAPTSDTKTDTINAARDTLDRNLTILAAKVEAIANSPTLVDDQRIGVIHSAGMDVRGHNQPKKRVFAVTQGETSGSVHLVAEGGANAHEWQYTVDTVNFTGRIPTPSTTKGRTDIHGLLPATKYAFFHKPIIANTPTDWEGPLLITVL